MGGGRVSAEVRFVEPLGPVAVIVTAFVVAPVASPSLPPALLMVATAGLVELQVTVVVRSCVVLSVYVPVAVNC